MVLHTRLFPSAFLRFLNDLSWRLIYPCYWLLDHLVASFISTTQEQQRCSQDPCASLTPCVLLFTPLYLLLMVLWLPIALLGFLVWAPVQAIRRPYAYSHRQTAHGKKGSEEWEPQGRSFSFGSSNVCLLPDSLSRFNNLSDTQGRAFELGRRIFSGASRPWIKIDAPTSTSVSSASSQTFSLDSKPNGRDRAVDHQEGERETSPHNGECLSHTGRQTVPHCPLHSTGQPVPDCPLHSTGQPIPDCPVHSTGQPVSDCPLHSTGQPIPDCPLHSTGQPTPDCPLHSTGQPVPDCPLHSTGQPIPDCPLHSTGQPVPDCPLHSPGHLIHNCPLHFIELHKLPDSPLHSRMQHDIAVCPLHYTEQQTHSGCPVHSTEQPTTPPCPVHPTGEQTLPDCALHLSIGQQTLPDRPLESTGVQISVNDSGPASEVSSVACEEGVRDSCITSQESLTHTQTGNTSKNSTTHDSSVLIKCAGPKRHSPNDAFHHEISAFFPANLDFLCLQEVFDKQAAFKLKQQLHHYFPFILSDVGYYGWKGCCSQFKCLNSGLLLASLYPILDADYYCYPNGRAEDGLAAKGVLFAKVQVGKSSQGKRIVGYISCTHLHSIEGDSLVRCEQLNMLLKYGSCFRKMTKRQKDQVAFDVVLGDLNFDNCSSEDRFEQNHALFSRYKDPGRQGPGQEQPWAIGTLLEISGLYDEEVCSPEKLQKVLENEAGRKEYLAYPAGKKDCFNQEGWKIPLKGNGRRIDYILYSEEGLQQDWKVGVQEYSFITQLTGLTDHLAVAMRLHVSTGEEEP